MASASATTPISFSAVRSGASRRGVPGSPPSMSVGTSKVDSVPNFDAVNRYHVLQALEEYDRRGANDFLSHYGFGSAREYVLWHDHKSYDSKAVLGVAHKYATGTVAARTEFSGGKDGAAKTLRALGFEVRFVDDAPLTDVPAIGTWRAVSEVGSKTARAEWAEAARYVLLDVARRYHGVVTYKDLATQVQHRTGIRTKQLMHYWIGDVLGRVSADCAHGDEPLLSSLCVNAEGSVGDGYAIAVRAASGETPGDVDDHAAHERLRCYRHFGAADLPADGGVPALTPNLAAARGRARKAKAIDRPVAICPNCHTQLPATGNCDFCD